MLLPQGQPHRAAALPENSVRQAAVFMIPISWVNKCSSVGLRPDYFIFAYAGGGGGPGKDG